ncbi:MAG: VanW family protein [Acidimicrobiales bacterium]
MRRPSRSLVLIGVGTAVLAVVLVWWLVDTLGTNADVGRGVEVAGVDVSGMTEAELRAALADASPQYGSTTVRLLGTDETVLVETDADALGIGLDVEATVTATLDHDVPTTPWGWAGSFFSDTTVPVVLTIDESKARAGVEELDLEVLDPIEPEFAIENDLIVLNAGQSGTRLDVDTTVAALGEAAGDDPIEVVVPSQVVSPSISNDQAQALADQANAATADGIVVRVGDVERTLEPAAVRPWLLLESGEESDADIRLGIDDELAGAGLRFAMGPAEGSGDQAVFRIVFGEVVIEDPDPVLVCCDEAAPTELLAALVAGQANVTLEPVEEPTERDGEWAESLGIEEVVGEFTTRYTAGQSRVTNIKRIAELTQGVVIEPGATFSVNDFIGRRTVEKGFVPAGVIYNGIYNEDVGGGISQYATTVFNAAFFAGLDFGEYQSHSLPISRYPYGREATLSFPNPDLEIVNNTPYGVLLWPTTTDTSITVQLWSTPFAPGVQSGQSERIQGVACTRVTTERTRTFVDDGRNEVDTVFAVYRPREGYDCNNDPTDPDFATTTAPPPPPPTAPPPPPPTTQPPPPPPPPPTTTDSPPPTTEPPPPTTEPPPPTTEPPAPTTTGG